MILYFIVSHLKTVTTAAAIGFSDFGKSANVTCYLSKASTEHLHFSRSAAVVLASAPDLHPASSLSFSTVRLQVVFLFFFSLRVPSSLRCCSRFFGPALVHDQSSSIFSTSLLHSVASCLCTNVVLPLDFEVLCINTSKYFAD